MSRYRNDLEIYLKTLEIHADKVLDIGGSALSIKDRVKVWDVKDYKILDNNNEKGLHGDKWREPDYIGGVEDGDLWYKISGKKTWPEAKKANEDIRNSFDVVFCLEVLEYTFKGCSFNYLFDFVKKGGLVYVTICEKYPVHNPVESDSTRYTKAGFDKVCKYCGMEILECIPRRYSPEAFKHIQEAWRIDGLRAARHYEYHDAIGFIYKLRKT